MTSTTAGTPARALGPTRCELGEGPTYDPITDTAWWFDILGRTLHEYRVGTDEAVAHPLPFMASALARVDGERQLLVTEHGLIFRDIATGGFSQHLAIEADDPTTRSNDARTHPSGAFWIGTMGKGAEDRKGSIYWYRKGELRKLFGDISITNCIAFSPAGDRGYFTDTRVGRIMSVALDPATGLPLAEPQPFGDADLPGDPDGAVVDAAGQLYVARWDGACVSVLAADGRHVEDIAVPAAKVTCPAFVGRNASKLLVTSAQEGMTDDERAKAPEAGMTFLLDLATTGRHDPVVMVN
ncbi:SMP-30/gluconolactonase/LRE family protein [Jiella endophytica]|uniref:SMP-30/gluconolactonase/LRE family protein n=1 Tax=Jiella endophytica TaxID=2558362 RepID=A0A4Y8RPP0_9HYPH|nr:SMP-30/gluconolactonase/LRE family protein [Jiella endophytica]TFF25549.1 SMP-30/gluconolactonase/LRE family protein [Jiella endophytica]